MEIAADVGAMATDDGACFFVEVMGRHAGWIAAGAVLAGVQSRTRRTSFSRRKSP